MAAKVLIVGEDRVERSSLDRALAGAGYTVVQAVDGAEGVRLFFDERPNLVLLETHLPTVDGWDVLKRIREVSDTPVIVLSALNEEKDTVFGLRSGADDYLRKPFNLEELLARCAAVLRRFPQPKAESEDKPYADALLQIDFYRREVFVKAGQVTLSPTEFKLLAALTRNRDTVLSPGTLIEEGWGKGKSSPENLRVYIGYLRKKLLDESNDHPVIENLRGFGYRYNTPA